MLRIVLMETATYYHWNLKFKPESKNCQRAKFSNSRSRNEFVTTIKRITPKETHKHTHHQTNSAMTPYLFLSASFGKLIVNLQRDARKEFNGSTA